MSAGREAKPSKAGTARPRWIEGRPTRKRYIRCKRWNEADE